eukprot:Rhum_TRINITY_DN2628_c0_g1::Rhum_TRINITY_DN2628_c0_g1_i1::g.7776::m.7776
MADREDVLRRLRTVHGMWRDPSSFHAPRVKALGHVLHSDLDMWPFAIRGEHDEMLPGVVATVLHEMGYEAEDKNVQAVIDEVAECRRMLKDMNHGLLGAGKVGEILRLVNQRRSEARESGATAVLGMLPCLEVLRCAFSADLEVLNAGKEKERDGGGVCEAGGAELASQALLLRAQHEHREFAFCAEAIISELLVVRQRSKSARAGDDDAAVLVSNEVLMRRHSRLAWTRCEVAARMYVDFDAILRDRAASRMWEGAFGVACHVELPRFVAAFEEHCGLGPAEACVSETVAGLMDECRDGVATLWAFHRLLALFGPLSTLAHTLAAEVRGGYLHPRLAECEARAALRGEPHAFVVIPAQDTACLRVVEHGARRGRRDDGVEGVRRLVRSRRPPQQLQQRRRRRVRAAGGPGRGKRRVARPARTRVRQRAVGACGGARRHVAAAPGVQREQRGHGGRAAAERRCPDVLAAHVGTGGAVRGRPHAADAQCGKRGRQPRGCGAAAHRRGGGRGRRRRRGRVCAVQSCAAQAAERRADAEGVRGVPVHHGRHGAAAGRAGPVAPQRVVQARRGPSALQAVSRNRARAVGLLRRPR